MFRPYNFKSLLAWTAGSLAGNKAYYDTKIKQATSEKISALSAQLAQEYRLYQKNGGSLELEAWLQYRASPAYLKDSEDQLEDYKKKRCEEVFGKFDPTLESEAISSFSILNEKIERIEAAVPNKNFTKSVFEDIFVILQGSEGFEVKYGNTISQIHVLRNQNLREKYADIWNRYKMSAEAAIKSRPDLWETVQGEMRQKYNSTPRLGLKLATWELVQYPPGTKLY